MRRDPNTPAGSQPYDLEAADHADITEQFWGATKGWTQHAGASGELPTTATGDGAAIWGERTGPIRAIRGGIADRKARRTEPAWLRTGNIERTRAHGIPRPTAAETAGVSPLEASLGELAGGAAMEMAWNDEWSAPTAHVSRSQAVTHDGARSTRRNAAVSRSRTAPAIRRHGEEPRPTSDGQMGIPSHETRFHDGSGHDIDLDLNHGDAEWRSPIAPLVERLGLGAVDPLLIRLGMIILAGVLALPIAYASRDGDAGTLAVGNVAAAAGVALQPAPDATAPAVDPVNQPATATDPVVPASASVGVAATPATVAESASSPAVSSAENAGSASRSAAESVVAVERGAADTTSAATAASPDVAVVEPVCALTYDAGPGDSWYRMAEGAGISPQALLDANLADLDSVIFPGDEICLPEGATMPPPPTTAPTTTAPDTTAAPTTTPTTAAAPTTTVAPPAPVSAAEVQRLIREIWPDDLEEKALQIAWRESNYKAAAWNGGCCYGVFQIHWPSHRGWLDDYGITSTNGLLDAQKNISAAFALYQRSGSWGPWGG